MQITIDSHEPLSNVTAVVGALYGVELVVAGAGSTAASADSSTPSASSASSGPDAPRRRRAIAASTNAKRSAGRARRGGKQVDAKVVRQWAVEQGLTVSARGQLPKSVLAAYSDSNG